MKSRMHIFVAIPLILSQIRLGNNDKIKFTVRYISIKMHRIVCIKQVKIKFGYYLTLELTFYYLKSETSRRFLLLFM